MTTKFRTKYSDNWLRDEIFKNFDFTDLTNDKSFNQHCEEILSCFVELGYACRVEIED